MSEDQNIAEENSLPDVQAGKEQITNSREEVANENISQEQTIESPQLQTTNSQLQTENMEVHKHPHHVMHKKKWTEYLLEFFMLFLAVFLGFVAENVRERFAEAAHAEEYAKSFLTDLKNDIVDLNRAAAADSLTHVMIYNLIEFINKPIDGKGGEFYYLSRLSCGLYITDWNRSTINQLLSSGTLRYFNNNELIKKVNEYNTLESSITSLQQGILELRNRAYVYRDQILKSGYQLIFIQLKSEDAVAGKTNHMIDSLRAINIPLQDSNLNLLNSYANAILLTESSRELLLKLYPAAKQKATEIINLLNEEYHLE